MLLNFVIDLIITCLRKFGGLTFCWWGHVSGGQAQFLVTFSMEVNDGFLVTNLPAHLINTTELKYRNNYQWQPLQTYVTISKHFMVKASGIRFQGTVNDCNSVMQQLFYHVSHVLSPWGLRSNHGFQYVPITNQIKSLDKSLWLVLEALPSVPLS